MDSSCFADFFFLNNISDSSFVKEKTFTIGRALHLTALIQVESGLVVTHLNSRYRDISIGGKKYGSNRPKKDQYEFFMKILSGLSYVNKINL